MKLLYPPKPPSVDVVKYEPDTQEHNPVLQEPNNVLQEHILVSEPETNNDTYTPGMFLYIDDECSRTMLQNAWISITQLNLWNYLLIDTESYMFNNDITLNTIHNKMIELGYDGHSGGSFGWTMRQMQYIANHGEEKYKNLFC